MEIININDKNLIRRTIEVINSGGLVIFPTETSYGVGVDATNESAVSKLLNYRKRPEGKAISVAVANQDVANELVEINDNAKNFYKNFLPGPVTIISQSKGKVDKRLESENGTLGIRIPNYKLMLEILSRLHKPITATSAIATGKMPYSIEDILNNISDKNKELIDLIIDAGQLPKNPPSTVIDTTTNDLTILRTGRIDPEKTKLIASNTTSSEEETIVIGNSLIEQLYKEEESLLVLLSGELGAGKTHLTKGIAQKLGVKQIIKSPTYNYVNEYSIDKTRKLYHMDAWKIQSKDDLNSLGFYDWFKNGNIIVVEWPSVIMNLDEEFFNKLHYIYVEFTYKSDQERLIKIFQC